MAIQMINENKIKIDKVIISNGIWGSLFSTSELLFDSLNAFSGGIRLNGIITDSH